MIGEAKGLPALAHKMFQPSFSLRLHLPESFTILIPYKSVCECQDEKVIQEE